ncbi:hypothetical protein [Desulfomonile tiedjei]|uniref:CHAT domain-containing protein n=1 Tax=Desulfomonile tiedjei (strain ATCC 49306 / DSM 6799 / DCB-1) TaxID=706587 RepID=I4C7K7_DESTA|nr:hypothetical protein [Desulfomonile tiedjei]AFM25548.1 hypothetical protein Desti_2879 [Desulfomonile tiedjei DSM 6799]
MALKRFVYVIESPSSMDLLENHLEGEALVKALDLAAIPRYYSLVTDRATFRRALLERMTAALQYYEKAEAIPILHLSMHGDDSGIGLTCGERLSWEELRQELSLLIEGLNSGLLICMSTCFGSSGCRMAWHTSEPFGFLVGNEDSVDWADAAVAYITFYHLLFKGYPIQECVSAMNRASRNMRFRLDSGKESKERWLLWQNFKLSLERREDFYAGWSRF